MHVVNCCQLLLIVVNCCYLHVLDFILDFVLHAVLLVLRHCLQAFAPSEVTGFPRSDAWWAMHLDSQAENIRKPNGHTTGDCVAETENKENLRDVNKSHRFQQAESPMSQRGEDCKDVHDTL